MAPLEANFRSVSDTVVRLLILAFWELSRCHGDNHLDDPSERGLVKWANRTQKSVHFSQGGSQPGARRRRPRSGQAVVTSFPERPGCVPSSLGTRLSLPKSPWRVPATQRFLTPRLPGPPRCSHPTPPLGGHTVRVTHCGHPISSGFVARLRTTSCFLLTDMAPVVSPGCPGPSEQLPLHQRSRPGG